MAFSTTIRVHLNDALAKVNLELTSLTAKRREYSRITELVNDGLFERAPYTLVAGMDSFDAKNLVAAYERYGDRIERLRCLGANDVGYDPQNGYFRSPDLEPLYLLVRMLMPRRIVEVGSGSSTRITRQAILDGGLNTKVIAIDPCPRNNIRPFVDRHISSRLEHLDNQVFEALEPGDFLFIDSSHEVRLGNDVARIFCDIVPRLKAGVILHFHDVYLPFEYPLSRVDDECARWGEQYVLHAFLQSRSDEILWPGYYLQRTRPDLKSRLPFLFDGTAQSFWFRLA